MVEIPGFDLPNRLIDLTTSLFFRGGIFQLNLSKFKQSMIINFSITKKQTWASDLLSRVATIAATLDIINVIQNPDLKAF
jgi:hypothetical protein